LLAGEDLSTAAIGSCLPEGVDEQELGYDDACGQVGQPGYRPPGSMR
jgi:hypothetical protein